jgi:hypothetical protein
MKRTSCRLQQRTYAVVLFRLTKGIDLFSRLIYMSERRRRTIGYPLLSESIVVVFAILPDDMVFYLSHFVVRHVSFLRIFFFINIDRCHVHSGRCSRLQGALLDRWTKVMFTMRSNHRLIGMAMSAIGGVLYFRKKSFSSCSCNVRSNARICHRCHFLFGTKKEVRLTNVTFPLSQRQ